MYVVGTLLFRCCFLSVTILIYKCIRLMLCSTSSCSITLNLPDNIVSFATLHPRLISLSSQLLWASFLLPRCFSRIGAFIHFFLVCHLFFWQYYCANTVNWLSPHENIRQRVIRSVWLRVTVITIHFNWRTKSRHRRIKEQLSCRHRWHTTQTD